jgi:hypothetical protein
MQRQFQDMDGYFHSKAQGRESAPWGMKARRPPAPNGCNAFVAPRWGAGDARFPIPGCAARAWALELNAFGVRIPRQVSRLPILGVKTHEGSECISNVPTGRARLCTTGYPAMNRWAIFNRPSGTDNAAGCRFAEQELESVDIAYRRVRYPSRFCSMTPLW